MCKKIISFNIQHSFRLASKANKNTKKTAAIAYIKKNKYLCEKFHINPKTYKNRKL